MSCGHIELADWRVEAGSLPQFLADWLKRGYSPNPPTPEPVLIDGAAYHRYRMVHIGV